MQLLAILVAIVIFVWAVGLGAWLLERLLPAVREDPFQRILVAAGLGLGALSLGSLALGALGIVSQLSYLVLLAVGFAAGARATLALAKDLLRWARALPPRKLSWFELAISGLCAGSLLLGLLFGFVPPLDYDSLEYHLALPAAYLRAGSIPYLPENVFSNFPQNVEMWYLACMASVADPLAGAFAGNVLNCLAALATLGVTAGIARRYLHPPASWAAPCLLGTCVLFALLPGMSYVETGQALFGALALSCLLRSMEDSPLPAPRRAAARQAGRRTPQLALAGIFCGLAMGSKYPSVLFLFIPLALVILAAGRVRPRFASLALFAAVSAATFSPWLLRNWVNTGNPVYPFLYRWLGGSSWSAPQTARFREAHIKKRSPQELLEILKQSFVTTQRMSWVLFLFAPLGLWAGRKNHAVQAIGVIALADVAFWLAMTHQVDRFFVPSLPFWALLSAEGIALCRGRLPGLVARGVALTGIAMQVIVTVQELQPFVRVAVGLEDRQDFLRQALGPEADAWRFVNEQLPPGARLLLVGEARTFYLDRPALCATVFDTNPLLGLLESERSTAEISAQLRAWRVTHVLVNWKEVERLQWSYSFWHEGRPHLGLSAKATPEAFRFLMGPVLRPVALVPLIYQEREYAIEIFEVMPEE